MASITASRRTVLADRIIGDGLVPLPSTLGRHEDHRRCLDFPKASQFIAHKTNHMALLHNPEITEQIKVWFAPDPSQEKASHRRLLESGRASLDEVR